jgi:hypothetical protein
MTKRDGLPSLQNLGLALVEGQDVSVTNRTQCQYPVTEPELASACNQSMISRVFTIRDHNGSAFCECRLLIRNSELGVSRLRRTHGWPFEGIPMPGSTRKGLAVGLGERVPEAANADQDDELVVTLHSILKAPNEKLDTCRVVILRRD